MRKGTRLSNLWHLASRLTHSWHSGRVLSWAEVSSCPHPGALSWLLELGWSMVESASVKPDMNAHPQSRSFCYGLEKDCGTVSVASIPCPLAGWGPLLGIGTPLEEQFR